MIAELGHVALILALLVSLVQATLPLAGAARGDGALMALAPAGALGQAALVAVAFGCLTNAYVTSDFSVANVYENSHSLMPLLYRVTGVWGNHEGSMVLWVLILALFGAAAALFGGNLPPALRARALAVQGMIGAAFLLFVLFTSNPFARLLPAPPDGSDLNPLLQDPGLAFHPPLLYLGYVGLSVTFSFAVAALIEGRVDAAWARWVRPWTLAAWTCLTAGIALGSWWAYYELGWGGWWFWDPVENASFMPWLLATALLHSAVVVERRAALAAWTILLAILAFSLSLAGTFLVRSGVLTSVHAFATDPARGLFILLILALATGGALVLFAVRAPALRPGGPFAPVSREGALVLNNLLLATACGTVLLGTLYPVLVEAASRGADRVSVGPPYFNATFGPIMAALVAAMAAGPLLAWKRADAAAALRRLAPAAAAAALAVAATFAVVDGPLLAPFGIGLAAWLLAGTLTELAGRARLFRAPPAAGLRRLAGLPRAALGMTLAHAGVAVFVAGAAGAAWTQERIQVLMPGESVGLAGYTLTLAAVRPGRGPNYATEAAEIAVTADGRAVATLRPERRFYPVQRRETTEAAIRSTALGDLYAVIGAGSDADGWVTRFYWNPLVPWLWAGALLMALGGLVSLSDRRHRIGAPARRRPAAAVPAPAPAE